MNEYAKILSKRNELNEKLDKLKLSSLEQSIKSMFDVKVKIKVIERESERMDYRYSFCLKFEIIYKKKSYHVSIEDDTDEDSATLQVIGDDNEIFLNFDDICDYEDYELDIEQNNPDYKIFNTVIKEFCPMICNDDHLRLFED